MSALRCLTIVHATGETGFSGGEVQVFLLIEGLRGRGHRSLLLCPPGSRSEAEARRRGIPVLPVPMRSSLSPLAVLHATAALRRSRPDLVHLHTGRANWVGAPAAALAGIPAVSTRRMDRKVARGPRTRWLYGRGVRRVVAISAAVRERLLEAGVPRERVLVIPSAVDVDALRPSRARKEVRRELGLADDDTCLLVLAALVHRKGIDVLLDALARLQDIERLRSPARRPHARGAPPVVLIAGDGDARADLERQALRLGLAQVRFLGRREDRADLLAACDALVLPSRKEGLGVAALEALACGRPVVASAVGGLGEAVVDGETGLLVPPEDPAALAGAISRIAGDASLRDRLAAAGPARVAQRHRPEAMTASYERLYLEVLEAART